MHVVGRAWSAGCRAHLPAADEEADQGCGQLPADEQQSGFPGHSAGGFPCGDPVQQDENRREGVHALVLCLAEP